MNTYSKYVPNVFLAKCTEQHEKGETIEIQTKYGKANECIVFNLIYQKEGYFFYSIVRADGYNVQERAKAKAERLSGWAASAEKKSEQAYSAAKAATQHIPFGQPILVGHHSEGRHRRDIKKSNDNMRKSVGFDDKAKEYDNRADYWKRQETVINLSMPESVEFYGYKLEQATAQHKAIKDGKIPREHSFSLTYAKKAVNEAAKNLQMAAILWE